MYLHSVTFPEVHQHETVHVVHVASPAIGQPLDPPDLVDIGHDLVAAQRIYLGIHYLVGREGLPSEYVVKGSRGRGDVYLRAPSGETGGERYGADLIPGENIRADPQRLHDAGTVGLDLPALAVHAVEEDIRTDLLLEQDIPCRHIVYVLAEVTLVQVLKIEDVASIQACDMAEVIEQHGRDTFLLRFIYTFLRRGILMGDRIYVIDIRLDLYARALHQREITAAPFASASGALATYPSYRIITGKDEQGGISGVIVNEQLASRQSRQMPFLAPVINSHGRRGRLQLSVGHHGIRPIPYMLG